MPAAELKKKAEAGTGLDNPYFDEYNRREEERRRRDDEEYRAELRAERPKEPDAPKVSEQQKAALDRIKAAKKKVEDATKLAEQNEAKMREARAGLLKRMYTPKQLMLMLAEKKAKKQTLNIDKIIADAEAISKEADEFLNDVKAQEEQAKLDAAVKKAEEASKAVDEAFKQLEEESKKPAPVQPSAKSPSLPPHKRPPTTDVSKKGVRYYTKQGDAGVPAPKPVVPPAGPTDTRLPKGKSLTERVDEQKKKGLDQYRAPLAFGSRQGRWETETERRLKNAQAMARLSAQDYRKSKYGQGRKGKRKNIKTLD
jgi:dTMP kinase